MEICGELGLGEDGMGLRLKPADLLGDHLEPSSHCHRQDGIRFLDLAGGVDDVERGREPGDGVRRALLGPFVLASWVSNQGVVAHGETTIPAPGTARLSKSAKPPPCLSSARANGALL